MAIVMPVVVMAEVAKNATNHRGLDIGPSVISGILSWRIAGENRMTGELLATDLLCAEK